MTISKIIFILPNIYECINGVSTKYIKFIEYLLKNSYDVLVFTTFQNIENYKKCPKYSNLTIIKTKGITLPFYKSIKIPILKEIFIDNYIKNRDEIIIFNGEFIWLYDILYNLKKKHNNIKLYPNMHTDYIYYGDQFYSKLKFKNFSLQSLFNYLDNYLENKIFDGIIVTGEKIKEKYESVCNYVFNANEVNLDIFNNIKKDDYHNNCFNIIYCGRISKEKNIEEVLDCCLMLNKYNYLLNIIGDGPYIDNLKIIIDIKYDKIKQNIIFHGSKTQEELNDLYLTLQNRIFLFTSLSETFGKTPMEAGATGIPIFIKKCDIVDVLYINKKNAYIFENKNDFLELFEYFLFSNSYEKELFINNSIKNIKKYDQNIIFKNWIDFLINDKNNKKMTKINFLDIFTFHSISKFINCSGSIIGD